MPTIKLKTLMPYIHIHFQCNLIQNMILEINLFYMRILYLFNYEQAFSSNYRAGKLCISLECILFLKIDTYRFLLVIYFTYKFIQIEYPIIFAIETLCKNFPWAIKKKKIHISKFYFFIGYRAEFNLWEKI